MTPRAGDEKVQSCRSWDISHPSVSVLYSWEMRRRLYFRFDRLCSHGCPQFHRAALPFAGPQPAIAMDWRAWMNTQTIPSEMCAHPTLGLSVSSAQGLPCTSCHEGYTAASQEAWAEACLKCAFWSTECSAGSCPAIELRVTQASDHSQSWLYSHQSASCGGSRASGLEVSHFHSHF